VKDLLERQSVFIELHIHRFGGYVYAHAL